MDTLKATVRCVRGRANRQQIDTAMTNPRDRLVSDVLDIALQIRGIVDEHCHITKPSIIKVRSVVRYSLFRLFLLLMLQTIDTRGLIRVKEIVTRIDIDIVAEQLIVVDIEL